MERYCGKTTVYINRQECLINLLKTLLLPNALFLPRTQMRQIPRARVWIIITITKLSNLIGYQLPLSTALIGQFNRAVRVMPK